MGQLSRLREQLGFRQEVVAAVAGWPESRLKAIEATDDLDELEAERLGDLYGVDIEAVLEGDAERGDQPVAALLRANAETLDAGSRFSMAEATTVARQIRQLETLLGRRAAGAAVERFQHSDDYSHPAQGTPADLSARVRSTLNLDPGPIRSVTSDVLAPLGVVLLWETLPKEIDAFSMCGASTGPVIVANANGAHMNTAFGRRVTWAHEVCHILFDRHRMRDAAEFCDIAVEARRTPEKIKAKKASTAYQIERRARAFAVELLVPEKDLSACWRARKPHLLHDRVRAVMVRFGVGYEAMRGQLDSKALLRRARQLDGRVDSRVPSAWDQADPSMDNSKVARAARDAGVSILRSGVLLHLLLEAWRTGVVAEAVVAEGLRIRQSQWSRLRSALEVPDGGTWRTSGALDEP